ncbi:MAG: hypothetical protein JNK45_28310, partial [Myxococcales bacterium]|nr:hypothetical protein [Myxococcales bacterium]
DGDVLWSVTPEADPETTQNANGIAIDSKDYVIVVGTTNPATGWVVKYTP